MKCDWGRAIGESEERGGKIGTERASLEKTVKGGKGREGETRGSACRGHGYPSRLRG